MALVGTAQEAILDVGDGTATSGPCGGVGVARQLRMRGGQAASAGGGVGGDLRGAAASSPRGARPKAGPPKFSAFARESCQACAAWSIGRVLRRMKSVAEKQGPSGLDGSFYGCFRPVAAGHVLERNAQKPTLTRTRCSVLTLR